MRRLLLSVFAVGAICLVAGASGPDYNLPQLNQIKEATLSPSYSCRPAEEFSKGYEGTALFLSDYSKQHNSPDLLYNGACGSDDYFESATAGDDMSLIADLGAGAPLEELTASRAFNLRKVHNFPDYSKFARVVKVEAGHTYAVLLSEIDRRGLFVFTVAEHVPNKKVSLKYAVKSYQVAAGRPVASPGFDWTAASAR